MLVPADVDDVSGDTAARPDNEVNDGDTDSAGESTRSADASRETSVEFPIEADRVKTAPLQAIRRISWGRVLAYGLLPALLFLLAMSAGLLKWLTTSDGDAAIARIDSVRAATEGTVAMLSYRPDTVQNDFDAAKDRLTGSFRDSYSSLTSDVIAPAAIQKMITAVATVPAAASSSATGNHAVVLAFVNQTVTVGNENPTSTASSVRVTLDKVGGRWLISGFDPV
jgi:Mce-associated membrane protein